MSKKIFVKDDDVNPYRVKSTHPAFAKPLSEKIVIADGKYAVRNDNGILRAWRYDERWSIKESSLIGDNFTYALVCEIERLRGIVSQIGNGDNDN